MRAILRMDSAQLSRLMTARTEQHVRMLGQNPNAPRQMRTSTSTCACGKHVAKSAPVAAALSPEAQRTQALDIYQALMKHPTETNIKAPRLILLAFPTLAEELAQMPAPPMPSLNDRVRANAQRQTSTVAPAPVTMRDLSKPSKPTMPPADEPVRFAACKVPSMIDRLTANAKTKK
jgi:hypothetical protein